MDDKKIGSAISEGREKILSGLHICCDEHAPTKAIKALDVALKKIDEAKWTLLRHYENTATNPLKAEEYYL